MKKIIKSLARFLLFCLMVFFTSVTVFGQEVSLDLENIKMDLMVRSNGDLVVKEYHTYQIDKINGIYHNIDSGDYSLSDYKVGVKEPDSSDIIYFKEALGGANDTYTIASDSYGYKVKAYYPVEDETLDFVFEYTLEGVVVNYADTAHLNYRLISDSIDDTYDFEATLLLPGEVKDKDSFRAWAHGAPQGQLELVNENGQSGIKLTVKDNPPGKFVEVQTLFPTYLMPNNKRIVEKDMFQEVYQAENKIVEEERAEYEREQNTTKAVGIASCIAGPAVIMLAYLYYKRAKKRENPNPAQVPEHIYSLPDDVTPAIMSAGVFKGVADSDDFSATIVDLARKGYLTLEEVPLKKRGLFNRGQSSTLKVSPTDSQADISVLERHEQAVYNYLIHDGKGTLLTELETKMKKDRDFKRQQNRCWESFKSYSEINGLRYAGARSKYRQRTIVVALCATGLGVLSNIIGTSNLVEIYDIKKAGWSFIPLLISLVSGVILNIVVYKKPVLTAKEDRLTKEWTAFKNMLSDIGNLQMREIASLPLWEEYLVYAISLGVGDKVLKAMSKEYGQDELATLSLDTDFYTNYYLINTMLRRSVSESLTHSAPPGESASYTGSNVGGFGGGFSGGSSGASGGSSSGGF